ncbi:unnamed protein product [Closterium sp. Yama58-4]|nr:unnamed protein product [Closterium sp. Yama58-4]
MFPYADAPHYLWTGYFASRANFKRYARACSSLLLATTILEAAVGKTALRDWGLKTHRMIATDEFLFDNHLGKNLKGTSGVEGGDSGGDVGEGGGGGNGEGGEGGNVDSGEWEEWESVGAGAKRRRVASTFPLEEAVAVAQHHDAITGTAQQHVNDDYILRLHRAAQEASTVVAAALVHLITQAAPTTLPSRSSSPTSSSTPQEPSRAFFTPTADPTMGPSDFPPFNSQPGDPTLDPAAQLQAEPWAPADPDQPQSFPEKPTLETASPFDPSMPESSETDPLFAQLHPELTQGEAGSNEGDQQQAADMSSFFPYNRQVPPVEETLQSQERVQWTDANQQEQPTGTVDVHAPQEEVSPGRRGQEMVLRGRDTITGAESSRLVRGKGEAGWEMGGEGSGAGSNNRGRRLLREAGVVSDVRQAREDNEQASTEGGDRRSASEGGAAQNLPVLDFQMCPLLNLSYCPPSETKLSPDQVLVVTVFNPLGWPRTEIVRFPVASPSVLVTDSSNSPISAQIVTETLVDPNTRALYIAAYTGQFPEEPQQSQQPQQPGQQEGQTEGAQVQQEGRARVSCVPCRGASSWLRHILRHCCATRHTRSSRHQHNRVNKRGFKADSSSGAGGAAGKSTGAGKEGDAALRVTFSKAAYGMTQMELVRQTDGEQVTVDVAKPVRSDVMEYVTQKGGAYIFDPTAEAANPTQRDDQVSIRVQRGPIVEEFSRQVAPWISETFRVYPGCDYAELHHVIGPTPEDSRGHEVVTRFAAPISSNKTFFTDSNGRRYLKRVVDHRDDWELTVTDPIAGNFYPVTVGAFIGDGEAQLSLLVDRAAGAASLAAGQLEVMLHRALVTVDMKGVGEILNEQISFNGNNQRLMRLIAPLQLAFAVESKEAIRAAEATHRWRYSISQQSHGSRPPTPQPAYSLPPNVAVISFQELSPRNIVLRLAHLYEADEHPTQSRIERVDLRQLLSSQKIQGLSMEQQQPPQCALDAALKRSEAVDDSTPRVRGHTFHEASVLPARESSRRDQPREGSANEIPCSANGDTRDSDAVATATGEATGRGETSSAVPAVGGAGSVTVDYSVLMSRMLTTGFQATCLGQAINEVNRMLAWRLNDDPPKPDDTEEERDPAFRSSVRCKIFLGFTSNLMSSGLRETFCFLAKHKLVDVIVTTAGGIEEDVIKCLAPTLLGDFSLAGKDLRAKGLNRIGNLLVPNNNYCLFEDWVLPVLDACLHEQQTQGVVWTPSKLIDRLGKEINHEESVLYWAHKNGIPVFCPAITDGSLGDMIYFHSFRSPGLLIDLVQDIRRMNGEAVNATPRRTGVIILGGGLPKHHICNANMMRNGADYAVYINTASEFDGSDSGARPDEAVSWGKIRGDATAVKVYCDATIAFPLLVAETFAPHLQERVQQQEQAKQNVQAREKQ